MIVGQKPAGQKHTKKIENRQKPTNYLKGKKKPTKICVCVGGVYVSE